MKYTFETSGEMFSNLKIFKELNLSYKQQNSESIIYPYKYSI
jgi:hypothetical protein